MGLQQTSITYNNSSFRHYYLCQYLPYTVSVDTLSRSLLKFKRGFQPDLNAWIDCSLEAFQDIPLSPDTIIIRALRHDETQARVTPPSSLDQLGQAFATRFNYHYQPSLLCKSKPTRSNKSLSRQQRETELSGTYSVSPEAISCLPAATPPHPATETPRPPAPSLLLIDDILTTGTTARMIIHALRSDFPHSSIQIFTLAKADQDSGLNRSNPLHGRNYHLQPNTGWVLAEDPASYQPVSTSRHSVGDIKNSIRNNFN